MLTCGWLLACVTGLAAGDLDLGARVQPVPAAAKFTDPDWHIWCGAPVRTPDGKCHLYFSRWPKAAGFMAWATRSEIAYAVADQPAGPYRFVNVALPARGGTYWDGSTTHNPNIVYREGKFLLYYMGNHGDGQYPVHRNNQRVGVALADRPEGPWTRFDRPIVDVSADPRAFDSLCVTNPAACLRPDGKLLLLYKAVEQVPGKPMGGKVRYGAALADQPEGPYTKVAGHIFEAEGDGGKAWMLAEDPFIWYSRRDGERYWAIARDVVGRFTGQAGGIALFSSAEGLKWQPAAHPRVLGRRFAWAEGGESPTQLERPALLFVDEVPVLLFGAVNGYSKRGEVSYNVHVPLSSPERP